MKQVQLFKNPTLQKWGLVGCLLVVLGSNVSFNPESQVLAQRNGFSGEMSLASTRTVQLPSGYKGLQLKVQLNDDKTLARYMFEKSNTTETTEAGSVCTTCVEKMEPVTVSIDPEDKENMEFIERTIIADATAKIDETKKTEKTEEFESEKIVRLKKKYNGKEESAQNDSKKDSKSNALEFDIEDFRCEQPEDSNDTFELADYKQCLSDNLQDLREACKDAVDEKYEKDRAAAGDKKKYSVRKQTSACEKVTKVYYNEEIRPALRMIKRSQISTTLQNYETNYSLAYNSAIQMGFPPEKAAEQARARAGLVSSSLIQGLTAQDLTAYYQGGLANIHQKVANYTQDYNYLQSFRTEYSDPMMNLQNQLRNISINAPQQTVSAADLFRQYMVDMDSPTLITPPFVPAGTQPVYQPQPSVQPGQQPVVQPGSGLPVRPVIGGGIPRTGNVGPQHFSGQQQFIQQFNGGQQMAPQQFNGGQQLPPQQFQQQRVLPQQNGLQPSPNLMNPYRQSGTLPGPSL